MNKFPKGSYEYENRHDFIKAIDESLPHRKTGYNGLQFREIFKNAENHIDELVKICVKKEFWDMYGVK